MNWLNYHHLHYFWTVAREGSVSAACRRLNLAQPTVSGQLRTFEAAIGHKLLERSGRGLKLTETGRSVYRYADDIFAIGAELLDELQGQLPTGRLRLRVGVADVLPKLIVYRTLLPVLSLPEPIRLTCYEGKPDGLIARLASHDLDVVLADTPLTPQSGVRAYSHRLGESGLAVFGAPALARRFRKGFPRSLDGAPVLLPTKNTALRRVLDPWFEAHGIRPAIGGEFEDSALLKVFGQSGAGLFFAPEVIEPEVRQQFRVQTVGRLPELKETFYAISMERKIRHPAVAILTDAARERLAHFVPLTR